jgi:uncharacterized protein
MKILQKDNGKTGMFFIEQEGKKVAELIYSWRGEDAIIMEHTEVNEVLEGKGAGKELVVKTKKFAQEKGIEIVPLCPFAKSIIDKLK